MFDISMDPVITEMWGRILVLKCFGCRLGIDDNRKINIKILQPKLQILIELDSSVD